MKNKRRGAVNTVLTWGYFFYYMTRFYQRSLSHYKTAVLRRSNPDFLSVGYDVRFDSSKNIYIGKNSYINGGALPTGKDGHLTIGDNCWIGQRAYIMPGVHIGEGQSSEQVLLQQRMFLRLQL